MAERATINKGEIALAMMRATTNNGEQLVDVLFIKPNWQKPHIISSLLRTLNW
jgi:hypothetical protein